MSKQEKVVSTDTKEEAKEEKGVKKSSDYLFIGLCAVLLFGNSFTANQPSPLQTQIQKHMEINDAQFNLYYSCRSAASTMTPFIINFALDHFSLKTLMFSIIVICIAGQSLFAIGLSTKIHLLCVAGRFIIGFSDSLTIFQQTVMCCWFTASQIPFAFSVVLLSAKIIRSINDNGASVFYLWTAGELGKDEVNGNSIALYAWLGVAFFAISLPASLMLGQMIGSSGDSNKDKKKSDGNTDETQKSNMSSLLNKTIILFIMNNAFGYGCLHAFYPNISKFFQDRFQFEPLYAGFISAIPYMFQSLSVPFLGGLTSYYGEAYFEILLFTSVAILLTIHAYYLFIPDVTEEGQVGGWYTFAPLAPFGFGHALFSTIQMSTVRKIVKKKEHLSRILTYVKMSECLSQCSLIFLAGYIRTVTGSYTFVTAMLAVCASIALFADVLLIHDQKAIGSDFLKFSTDKKKVKNA